MSNIWFEIIFQIHRLSFHFWLHNFLVLCDPTYVFFALLLVLLASYLKQIPKSVFLFGILQFYILYLDFSSALTFVYGIKIQFYYFCMGAIQFSQYELLEKLYFFFLHCVSVAPSLKISWLYVLIYTLEPWFCFTGLCVHSLVIKILILVAL